MYVLQDNQQVPLTIAPTDAAGNPALLDEVPSWVVGGANPGILTLTPSADGLSCVASANGPLGTAQIQVTAAADASTGGQAITGTLDVQVVGSTVSSLSVNAGAPTAKS